MFRWARRMLTFLSFALFAGCAFMFVRSYRAVDFISHQRIDRSGSTLIWDQRILVSGRGGAFLALKHSVWTLPHPDLTEDQIQTLHRGWQHEVLASGGYAGDYFQTTKQAAHFGFGRAKLETAENGINEISRLIVFPWGAAIFLFAVLPFIGLIRFIKARRRIRRLRALNWNGVQTRQMAA